MPTLTESKFTVGNRRYVVNRWIQDDRIYFQFGYNPSLQQEIKSMRGSRYHGYDEVNPRKIWSVDVCPRNDFQIRFLETDKVLDTEGKPVPTPYSRYDELLIPVYVPPRWNAAKQKEMAPLSHHPTMIAHMIQRRRCIVASEMGTAKTFAVIHALEKLNEEFKLKYGCDARIWYVAPRSALRAVEREFKIWGCKLQPEFKTYENVVKSAKNWEVGDKAIPFIILDESSKVKTLTSQRTQACMQFADGARADWGDDAVIILMSGTPAPKSPVDWYAQCEIACPGFLKEGDQHKFANRLGIIVKKENFQGGGVYPHLVTWRDDEKKCDICGKLAADEIHHSTIAGLVGDTKTQYDGPHPFKPSINEIAFLYERLKGLVIVYFKKDVLDLPDKAYRILEIKASPSTMRAASLIAKSAKTTIEGLTRLRELSDGFQYIEVKDGKKRCQRCSGHLKVVDRVEIPKTCPHCKNKTQAELDLAPCLNHNPDYNVAEVECPRCKGTGEEDKYVRNVKEVPTPKEQVLIDLLDEYEDVGRVVIYAGFTAAIDRCVRVCQKQKWVVIRLDQGKELIVDENNSQLGISDYISLFQDRKEDYPRVALVAHPGSAGMGLTLTESPVVIYFSNDFNGENRTQSEDRIHRPGMDYNLGATIIDLIHLPSDLKVRNNLLAKRNLELMSLGELNEALKGDDNAGERIT